MRAPAIDMCATTDDGLAIFDTDGVYKIHIASGNLVLTKGVYTKLAWVLCIYLIFFKSQIAVPYEQFL